MEEYPNNPQETCSDDADDLYALAWDITREIKEWCAYNVVPLAKHLTADDMKTFLEQV